MPLPLLLQEQRRSGGCKSKEVLDEGDRSVQVFTSNETLSLCILESSENANRLFPAVNGELATWKT